MKVLQWIKNTAKAFVQYFKPANPNLSIELEQETLLDIQEPTEEELEIVIELLTQVETGQNNDSVSAYTVVSSLLSLILSKENLPRIGVAAVFTGINTGFNFIAPWLLGETIKILMSQDETTHIAGIDFTRSALIVTMVSAYTLSQILPNIRDQILEPVTENNTKKILEKATAHLLKKSLDYQVNTPFSDQIYLIQKSFTLSSVGTPLLTQIAPTLFETILACTVLTRKYGSSMGFGILGLIAAYTIYSATTAKPIINAREKSLNTGNAAYEKFSGAITRYKTMHDFGKFEETMQEVNISLNNMAQSNIRAINLPLQIGIGHIAISRLSMLLAALYVGSGVQSGRFNAQDFTVLVSYLGQLSSLLPAFGAAVNQLFASYPDLKFVLGELAKPDEVVDLHPENPLLIDDQTPPSIEFDNVSFSYPAKSGEKENMPLFQNLSFKIQPGQKVAFVSESGAGKTTIFNLLYGYYQPSVGTIKINGQDTSEVSLNSLQSQISLLGQNPNLFKGSVRANICYGAQNPKEINDEMIWELAGKAGLYKFLQSLKLDTDVGENGKALSGGQQQKVAILRGLLKKSSIRLMDEITAPFDAKSATKVLQKMNEACEGITSLMITHKLTEAQDVDTIIVLDKGQVVAQGSHAELLENCALYKKLWSAYISQNSTQSSSSLLIKNETDDYKENEPKKSMKYSPILARIGLLGNQKELIQSNDNNPSIELTFIENK